MFRYEAETKELQRLRLHFEVIDAENDRVVHIKR
jgi:hypothetical protein